MQRESFATQVNLNGLFCVELPEATSCWKCSGLLYSGSPASGCGSIVWTIGRSVEQFLTISLLSLEKGTRITAGSLLCWWLFTPHGNFKSIVNSKKLVLNFLWGLCSVLPFFFFFFFLERHTINILCRGAWLILHSGGDMSKPHLDSWVKYTGQRNLWDPEKLMCRMKRSHLPLFSSTHTSPFFTLSKSLPLQHWGAHCEWWCCGAWHHPAEKIECHLIMQPSCGKHRVCNQIDRGSLQNPWCEQRG